MVRMPVRCPDCQSVQVIKCGRTDAGKQRYRCLKYGALSSVFPARSNLPGALPVPQTPDHRPVSPWQWVRDTACVLGISAHTLLVTTVQNSEVEGALCRGDVAEVDAIWSCAGKKRKPHWLWYAIDHRTGLILAYMFGRRKVRRNR